MNQKYKKLLQCVALDAVGMITMAIPAVGPFLDILWAPVAASISYKMFGEKRGKYTSLITFVEELLPATDVVPSFTIFWFLFDFLQIGKEKEPIMQSSETTHNKPIDIDYIEIK